VTPRTEELRRRLGPLLVLTLSVLLLGCGGSAGTFNPSGPCTADGRAPGAFPDLEAKLPRSLGGIAPADGSASAPADLLPTKVDSGRNCTEGALSTLWAHGIRELRYAGAIWDRGGGDGTASAFFATPPGQPALQAAWMEEFYQAGAEASTKTENIKVTHPTVDPAGAVFELETLNDLSLQTVVVWPATDGVRVVIVGTRVAPGASRTQHDDWVQVAVSQSVTRTKP
jgi:hypothetical protein